MFINNVAPKTPELFCDADFEELLIKYRKLKIKHRECERTIEWSQRTNEELLVDQQQFKESIDEMKRNLNEMVNQNVSNEAKVSRTNFNGISKMLINFHLLQIEKLTDKLQEREYHHRNEVAELKEKVERIKEYTIRASKQRAESSRNAEIAVGGFARIARFLAYPPVGERSNSMISVANVENLTFGF